MDETPAARYVRLALHVDRHVEGMVDGYAGPPELKAEVEAGPPLEPRVLAAEAEALHAELGDGWLRDQVRGLCTYAGVLAGQRLAYADEVEGCYGIRPTFTGEAVFAAAHERLDELLPGGGTLAERHERWRQASLVPGDKAEQILSAVIETARAQTARFADLPDGEGVELEIVRGVPWMGFCEYQGGLQSKIQINGDMEHSAFELLRLALHETYPGHHVERVCKDRLLVQGRGLLEHTLFFVPAPQSIIAEGIATLAPYRLLEGEGGAELAAILHDAGIELDLERALAVGRALEPCGWADVNAALLFHQEGAPAAEVQAYIERWGLHNADIAAHIVRFMQDPTSRSYLISYSAGRDLCGAYVEGRPERFQQLLTEQVRIGELLAAPSATGR